MPDTHTIPRPRIAMDTDTVSGRPGMSTVVDNNTEWRAIAHLRGCTHNTAVCPLCTIERDLHDTQGALIRARAALTGARRRAIRAEINEAYLTHED